MKTQEKIKGLDIVKGMTILVHSVYTENAYEKYCGFSQFAITPKKNKKTEALTILDAKEVMTYDTGNGRAFTKSIICLDTAEYGKVCIYSTNNFILA